ncbi:LLM class flavin-dependent oxidoreductase [Thiobacter aerophilum]|uniref:LLM class flavin-dependent oxidoreductase n=1 Tax=Thiobacter aerophilum TaxID=3121275 RepID=A0ABV0EDC2_9BURK
MHFDLFHELAMPPALGRSEAQAVDDWLQELMLADNLGFRCAWLVEHHFTRHYSHSSAPDLLLAAAAMRTRRLRLGLGVIPLPHHHPVRVAERVATLDVLSHGRLEVGIGRGFAPQEYRVFGAPMEESRARTEAGLAVLRASFARGPVTLADGTQVDILPKPLQAAPPLWAAAVSPESFHWAAGQQLNLLAGPFKPWFMTRADIAAYRAAWQGDEPPAIGMTLGVFCLPDGRRARRLAAPAFEWFYGELLRVTLPVLERLYPSYEHFRELGRFRHLLRLGVDLAVLRRFGMAVVGSPAECIDRLSSLAEAGVTHVLCAVGAGAMPTELTRESLQVLASEVIPALQRDD